MLKHMHNNKNDEKGQAISGNQANLKLKYWVSLINKRILKNQSRYYTNLPSELIIREGARVMFLTNRLFKEELCNGSIGVITKLIDENHIDVAFPINSGLNQVVVEKITTYFNINGIPAQ
jgi:ATP-dependent exoDNAse (exonuclease V) alpha subunit